MSTWNATYERQPAAPQPSLKQLLRPAAFGYVGYVAKGLEDREIARASFRALNTVKKALLETRRKLGIKNRVVLAVRYALEEERGLYK